MIIHQIDNSYGNYNYNAFIYTNITWDSHFHGNYELVYTIAGNTHISINGEESILLPGELILISPYMTHSVVIENDTKTWIGVFSEDFIISFAQKKRFSKFSKFTCSKKIENILTEYLFYQGKPEHYMLMAYLYMVCNECIKNAFEENSHHNIRFVDKVIKYISQNICNEISIKKISTALNYEYHYFSYLFNMSFSMNFKKFINMFRFEQACRLLTDDTNEITTVCNECGFGSIRNFNRVFKELSGYTPTEYRKQLQIREHDSLKDVKNRMI